jgi:hypothetical protein
MFGRRDNWRSRLTERGRDLPDAGGSRFLTLNGGFGGANRSLIGQEWSLRPLTQLPQSRHSVSRTPKQRRAHRMAVSFNASTLWIDTYDLRALASSRTECYRQRA